MIRGQNCNKNTDNKSIQKTLIAICRECGMVRFSIFDFAFNAHTMKPLELSALQAAPAFLVASVLFVLIIISYILGYRLRLKNMARNQDHAIEDLGAINGATLGLLALLLAFTFGMANERYDLRRELVIREANAIGTAVLRSDVYPDSMRTLLRSQFKQYVEARIAFYEARMDMKKTADEFKKGNEISSAIWETTTRYAKLDPVTTKTAELIPALNDMIDITTTRRAAGESTIPDSIMYFLFSLCLCSSFLLGYDRKNKFDWIVVVGFALMLAITLFTIIDLDRPRSGLIDMDTPNQKIIELRSMFN